MADQIVKDLSENFLNCCICMRLFKIPKMLPCIHSFCQECLLKYAKTQKGNDIACPTCRKVCTLPESGVKGLQTNFHLVNLAEKVTLLEKLTSPKKETNVCDSCKRQRVVSFCFDCNFAICSKCKDQHTLFPVLRSHTVVPIEEIADAKFQTGWRNATSPFCDLHSSEKLNFYCKTCTKLICRDCTIVLHSKPDHEFTDVATQVSTVNEALKAMFDKSNDNLTKGLHFIQRGKEGSKRILKTSKDLKREITQHFRRRVTEIEKILTDQKSSLIKVVSDEENEKVKNIETKLQLAEEWVGRMRNAQDLTQHVIAENNPWELLGMSAELMGAFQTLQVGSEELDWCDSHLQQDIMFNPEQQSDIHLGSCIYPSEAVDTDPNGNFILCHFDHSKKTLYLRILLKESNYSRSETFPPYQWKNEIDEGASLHVTAERPNFLYVALGKVVAKFNCTSKECLNEKEIYGYAQHESISYIAYSPRTNQVFICFNENKFACWDTDLNNRQNSYALNFRVMFMFPSQYDVLLGYSEQRQICKYFLNRRTHYGFTLPSPPEFETGEVEYCQGFRKAQRRNVHGSSGISDEFVCFIVWISTEGNENKSKRWVLKEYCTQNQGYIGVLDDLGGEEVKVPAALYCKDLGNGWMEIHLCDSEGKVSSYKRGNRQGNNPAQYQKYDPTVVA